MVGKKTQKKDFWVRFTTKKGNKVAFKVNSSKKNSSKKKYGFR